MTKVTIDRELLERVVKADASNGASSVDLVDGWKAMRQIRAILAAPRQPEGELPEPDFALDGGAQPCYYAETVQRAIAQLRAESERTEAAFNAVIGYMLGKGSMEEPMEFLRCWNNGDFDTLRREWPDAPPEIYYADPLAEVEP